MTKCTMFDTERIAVINRVADWCFDNTESWAEGNIGLGLAYLFWAIAADDGTAFATEIGDYSALVALLAANPNGLLDLLVTQGWITVPPNKRKRPRSKKH